MPAPIPCLYWPVAVATSGMVLRLRRTPNATGVQVETDTTITAATYATPTGSGSLAAAVGTDFGTINGVTVAVSVNSAGVATITVSGLQGTTACRINWPATAATQALGTALGFDVSTADEPNAVAGVATFTGDYAIPRYWTPDVPVRSDEPITDQEVNVGRTYGGQNTLDVLGRWQGRAIRIDWIPEHRAKRSAESGAYTNGSLERFLEDDTGPAKFRWWDDRDTLGSGSDDYFLDAGALERIRWSRFSEAVPLYSVTLDMWEFTS